MPTLRELDGKFLKLSEDNSQSSIVDFLSDADGVMFLCPKCFKANKGKVGTHSVICWFVGKVPDEVSPHSGRWNPSGTGLDDLTFVEPRACSVKLIGGCEWHGFVKNGSAE